MNIHIQNGLTFKGYEDAFRLKSKFTNLTIKILSILRQQLNAFGVVNLI